MMTTGARYQITVWPATHGNRDDRTNAFEAAGQLATNIDVLEGPAGDDPRSPFGPSDKKITGHQKVLNYSKRTKLSSNR